MKGLATSPLAPVIRIFSFAIMGSFLLPRISAELHTVRALHMGFGQFPESVLPLDAAGSGDR